jgi:hypothetical protein
MNIFDVPIDTIALFLEASAVHPNADQAGVAAFAGRSISTAKKALPVLEELGLVARKPDGSYLCGAHGVTRGISNGAVRQILRGGILGYRPFELLMVGINLGESVSDAVRKTCLLSKIDFSEAPKFDILVRWATDLKILRQAGNGFELAPEIKVAPGEELAIISTQDLESKAKARLYIATKTGRDVYNFLDEIDKTLLVEAALEYRMKPRDSVEHSGQALEDFLRDLALAKGLAAEAKKCNGAGQLASILVSKSIIHTHHQHFIDGLGAARNATAHRKDKKTLVQWNFTDVGAFWAFCGVLAVITSVYLYVYEGKQII